MYLQLCLQGLHTVSIKVMFMNLMKLALVIVFLMKLLAVMQGSFLMEPAVLNMLRISPVEQTANRFFLNLKTAVKDLNPKEMFWDNLFV